MSDKVRPPVPQAPTATTPDLIRAANGGVKAVLHEAEATRRAAEIKTTQQHFMRAQQRQAIATAVLSGMVSGVYSRNTKKVDGPALVQTALSYADYLISLVNQPPPASNDGSQPAAVE